MEFPYQTSTTVIGVTVSLHISHLPSQPCYALPGPTLSTVCTRCPTDVDSSEEIISGDFVEAAVAWCVAPLDFGNKSMLSLTVWAGPHVATDVVEPFHTGPCVHSLLGYTEATIWHDNEALYDICRCNLDIKRPACWMLCFELGFLPDCQMPGGGHVALNTFCTEVGAGNFRQYGSTCPGHSEYRWTSGVETTTGTLGPGVANSVGMALSSLWYQAAFNQEDCGLFNFDVNALAGDGCLQEGVSGEASTLAWQLRFVNLRWIWDCSQITIEGLTDFVTSGDIATRSIAFDWNVERFGDAHDNEALIQAFMVFKPEKHLSTLLIVDSHSLPGEHSPAGLPLYMACHLGRLRSLLHSWFMVGQMRNFLANYCGVQCKVWEEITRLRGYKNLIHSLIFCTT